MSKLNYHIDKITRKVFKEKNFALAQLVLDWDIIIKDPLISQQCMAVKITFPTGKNLPGTLYLQADSALAPIISQKETDIVNNISSFFGYKAIEKIKILHN